MPCSIEECLTPEDGITVCEKCGESFCTGHLELEAHDCRSLKKRRDRDTSKSDKITPKKSDEKSVSIRRSGGSTENEINEIIDPVLEVHHIDVGQGESTLIRYIDTENEEDCRNILIDGGLRTRGGDTVSAYLKLLEIDTLHGMICSHYDADHFEGLKRVFELDGFVINKHIHSCQSSADMTKAPAKEFIKSLKENSISVKLADHGKADFEVKFGETDDDCFKLKCLKIFEYDRGKDSNKASLPWLLSFGKFKYYTAGDLESTDENTLIDKLNSPHLCAFKCGHHGSHKSTDFGFVSAVKPRVAFISAGKHGHSHPRPQVIKNLTNCNELQQIYLTNCFHDRRYVNPNYSGADKQDDDKIKGRVAGDDNHFGTIILRMTASQAKRHEFHVGCWVDGTWTPDDAIAKWRWYLHKCEDKVTEPAEHDLDDLGGNVELEKLEAEISEDTQEYWKLSVVTHHKYFEPTKDQKIQIAMTNQKMWERFKVQEGHNVEHPEEWEKYADASSWLWQLLLKMGDEKFVPWGDDADGAFSSHMALKNDIKNTLIPELKTIFDDEYAAQVEKVKRHPEGSAEHSNDPVIKRDDPNFGVFSEAVKSKFLEDGIKANYKEAYLEEFERKALLTRLA